MFPPILEAQSPYEFASLQQPFFKPGFLLKIFIYYILKTPASHNNTLLTFAPFIHVSA